MDIYQALKKDHDELKPLLEKLVMVSENDASTKALLDQIRDELVPHSRAEEAVFYNSLREIDMTKDLVMHSYREHMEAETLLTTLRGLEKIDVDWTSGVKKLRDALFHHIAEEEGKVFAAARQVLLEQEAVQMAAAFERLKQEAKKKGDFKNALDLVANLMPKRFAHHKEVSQHGHS